MDCNKSFRKDEPPTSWIFLQHICPHFWGYNSNHAQKWGQICCKSVQLVRGSSFRTDLSQNSYFSCLQPTHLIDGFFCYKLLSYTMYVVPYISLNDSKGALRYVRFRPSLLFTGWWSGQSTLLHFFQFSKFKF